MKQATPPQIVNIELTNRCNLKCVFCDHTRLKSRMRIGDFDTQLLSQLLSSLRGFDVFELGLVGLGEPLLDKQLETHLGVIAEHAGIFTRISLNTNAVALNAYMTSVLLNSDINLITCSLNATNQNAYRRLMGRNLFGQVIGNIKNFIHARHRLGRDDLKISIQYMSSELNHASEMTALFEDVTEAGVEIYNRLVYNKPVLQEQDGPQVNRDGNGVNDRRYPCWSMYSRVYVDIDGNVYPCTIGNDCHREDSALNIGNIRRHDLVTTFNAPEIQAARKMAENGQLPFPECRDCTAWSLLPCNFKIVNDKWVAVAESVLRRESLDRKEDP